MNRKAKPAASQEANRNASLLTQQVGKRVKEARLLSGWSCGELGARLGVSGQQIQKYEIGRDAVPLYRLLAIASLCGVPPQTFWLEPDTAALYPDVSGPVDRGTLELMRAYRRIGDPRIRKRILQLVRQMAGE